MTASTASHHLPVRRRFVLGFGLSFVLVAAACGEGAAPKSESEAGPGIGGSGTSGSGGGISVGGAAGALAGSSPSSGSNTGGAASGAGGAIAASGGATSGGSPSDSGGSPSDSGGAPAGGSGGSSSDTGGDPLGNGWVEYSPEVRIHLDDTDGLQTFTWSPERSVCSPTCADYEYDEAADTEIFRILDSRSNRSEIRLHNDYSTGSRQFEGYVTFDAPLNDESLFQIFGSTSGATQLMIRGYAANGGQIRANGATVAEDVYGVEHRVNVIHRQGDDIRIYIDGSLEHTIEDDENVSNYHKYGCYGTLRTGAATVRWRATHFYRDGEAP